MTPSNKSNTVKTMLEMVSSVHYPPGTQRRSDSPEMVFLRLVERSELAPTPKNDGTSSSSRQPRKILIPPPLPPRKVKEVVGADAPSNVQPRKRVLIPPPLPSRKVKKVIGTEPSLVETTPQDLNNNNSVSPQQEVNNPRVGNFRITVGGYTTTGVLSSSAVQVDPVMGVTVKIHFSPNELYAQQLLESNQGPTDQ